MPQRAEHIAVNDLLGKPPGWLLRSGTTLVFVVVLIALLLAAFIHYPDELSGEAVIEREQAPINIAPGISAPLDTLLSDDGDTVAANQIIGLLKSEADWTEVLTLDKWLDPATGPFPTPIPDFNNLGTLQALYASWRAAATSHQHYSTNSGLPQQLQSINREIAHIKDLIQSVNEQLMLIDQQIKLESRDFERKQQLAAEGVISAQELEEKEKSWLGIKERKVVLKANLVQHQLRINQLQQQSQNSTRDNGNSLFELNQSYERLTEDLRGQLQAWKDRYLLLAPADGQLVFINEVIEKQLVIAGETLFSVQPFHAANTSMLAKIKIPGKGLGKVRVGDKVVIRLDAYPEREFGSISSTLSHIAALPQSTNDDQVFYHLEARLQEPMITNYGRELPAQISMSGTGTIITKDRSVLDRIFEQLFTLIKQD